MEKWKVKDCKTRGKVERVEYTSLNSKGERVYKYANVYLPYGYTDAKKYDILYLVHGGGGNADAWFDHCPLKNMLDHMIAGEEIKPMIVVTPDFYTEEQVGFNADFLRDQILIFQRELAEDLIPCVEGKYSTYAESVKDEDIKASRMHRAIGGFSMGGGAVWFAVTKNTERFGWYMPISGGSWELEVNSIGTKTEETIQAIIAALHSANIGDDYFIYTATGEKDIAYLGIKLMGEELPKYPEFDEKHFRYHIEPEFVHAYEDVVNYLPLILPEFFR